jgi:tryptophanyl-tRNA synthetase
LRTCDSEKKYNGKILTGVQSTGTPHLGNLLGAIIPAIKSNKPENESFLFIADFTRFTQIKNRQRYELIPTAAQHGSLAD